MTAKISTIDRRKPSAIQDLCSAANVVASTSCAELPATRSNMAKPTRADLETVPTNAMPMSLNLLSPTISMHFAKTLAKGVSSPYLVDARFLAL